MKKIARGEQNRESVLKYDEIEYEDVSLEFEFLGRSKVKSTRKVHAVVKKDVTRISRIIYWTGSSPVNIRVDLEHSDQDITLEQRRKGDAYEYDICFGRESLQKGFFRELKYCIIIEARDEQGVMEPYFAHMVKHKTKRLDMRLIVPKGEIAEKIHKTVYADLKMDLCIQGNTDDCLISGDYYGDDGKKLVYEYLVTDANVNYTYAIEWVFTK